jgi:hypothetical protein
MLPLYAGRPEGLLFRISSATILLTLPPVSSFLVLPLDSALTCLVTFLAMSRAIKNGTPERAVVTANRSLSNFSFLPLDRRMDISTGFLRIFLLFF